MDLKKIGIILFCFSSLLFVPVFSQTYGGGDSHVDVDMIETPDDAGATAKLIRAIITVGGAGDEKEALKFIEAYQKLSDDNSVSAVLTAYQAYDKLIQDGDYATAAKLLDIGIGTLSSLAEIAEIENEELQAAMATVELVDGLIDGLLVYSASTTPVGKALKTAIELAEALTGENTGEIVGQATFSASYLGADEFYNQLAVELLGVAGDYYSDALDENNPAKLLVAAVGVAMAGGSFLIDQYCEIPILGDIFQAELNLLADGAVSAAEVAVVIADQLDSALGQDIAGTYSVYDALYAAGEQVESAYGQEVLGSGVSAEDVVDAAGSVVSAFTGGTVSDEVIVKDPDTPNTGACMNPEDSAILDTDYDMIIAAAADVGMADDERDAVLNQAIKGEISMDEVSEIFYPSN
jgi:hypothetical protein